MLYAHKVRDIMDFPDDVLDSTVEPFTSADGTPQSSGSNPNNSAGQQLEGKRRRIADKKNKQLEEQISLLIQKLQLEKDARANAVKEARESEKERMTRYEPGIPLCDK
jgi:hypothetical protein